MHKKYLAFYVAGNVASFVFVACFVWSFFEVRIFEILGPYIFVMLTLGAVFEFVSLRADLEEQPDLSPVHKLGVMALNNVIVVPGYVVGLMVGLRYSNV